METPLYSIRNYFKFSQQYFWQWAEGGEVVEWRNGDTICYRDDLANILAATAESGLPPIGTILLLLVACQDKSLSAYEKLLIETIQQLPQPTTWRETMEGFASQAIEFMELIQALPVALRSGNNRIHLLNALIAKIPNKIPAAKAKEMSFALDSGEWDGFFVKRSGKIDWKTLKVDLENLRNLFGVFTTKEELALLLRTGLEQLPSPVDIEEELPAIDILTQLAGDPKTQGLARLTKHLLAALRIPMKTVGASDMPLGGVSDITNRGDFDRLLLSELAQDEDMLSVRLVNNEALYLRREEPPDQRIQQRIILIDQTIKMWGVPRVFAMSAALALGEQNREKVQVESYGLGGRGTEVLNLNTREGVIKALEGLDVHLHAGKALHEFVQENSTKENPELILITEESAFFQADFQGVIQSCKGQLHFVILVNRFGELTFFQYINGSRKLLRKSTFNLEELLFSPSKKPLLDQEKSARLPMALRMERFPLLLPTTMMNLKRAYTYHIVAPDRVVSISPDQRLLLWMSKTTGAIELRAGIEKGKYAFGYDDENMIYVVAQQTQVLHLYSINLRQRTTDHVAIDFKMGSRQYDFRFDKPYFKTSDYSYYFKLDTISQEITKDKLPHYERRNELRPGSRYVHEMSEIKKIINPGYSTLTKVKRVYVNQEGHLTINKWAIRLEAKQLKLVPFQRDPQQAVEPRITENQRLLTENPALLFSTRQWADGSTVWVDPRGFLHLRIGNSKRPEVTLVLVLNMPMAAWASDGICCGPSYFTEGTGGTVIDSTNFYEKYIQPFIKMIR